jgi:hypothetical protein
MLLMQHCLALATAAAHRGFRYRATGIGVPPAWRRNAKGRVRDREQEAKQEYSDVPHADEFSA